MLEADAATRLIVVRHGQTAWNVETRIQGQLDIALNAQGRWQAAQLAQALRDEDIAAVYSSDLLRAATTAQALADAHALPVIFDRGLRERGFGSFEGLTFAEIEQQRPQDAARWRAREPGFAPGGGENLIDFSARCVGTVCTMAARHGGQCIALVAHGGVLDVLYRAATHLALDAPRSWQLGNASINRLLYSAQGLSLVGWSDERHLEGGDTL